MPSQSGEGRKERTGKNTVSSSVRGKKREKKYDPSEADDDATARGKSCFLRGMRKGKKKNKNTVADWST